mmetsp:Transcript_5869/g.18519  ORF Transcript_5869/g.18519 Transcript_5869/m.18519 type:complete len:227 (+) Transcript_5869:1189-1869(+)
MALRNLPDGPAQCRSHPENAPALRVAPRGAAEGREPRRPLWRASYPARQDHGGGGVLRRPPGREVPAREAHLADVLCDGTLLWGGACHLQEPTEVVHGGRHVEAVAQHPQQHHLHGVQLLRAKLVAHLLHQMSKIGRLPFLKLHRDHKGSGAEKTMAQPCRLCRRRLSTNMLKILVNQLDRKIDCFRPRHVADVKVDEPLHDVFAARLRPHGLLFLGACERLLSTE